MSAVKKKDCLIDKKGRLVLGSKFSGRKYIQAEQNDGTIILTPAITIPVKEAWLWKNEKAMESVSRGLNQLNDSKRIDRGDFLKYLTDEDK